MRGGEALEVRGGKVLGESLQAGDPDYSAVLWRCADEERGQEVGEEVVTEDVGAEDFPERWVRGCLGVIGYWIDGFIFGVILLGGCGGAYPTDFESWVCDGMHWSPNHTPDSDRPIDAYKAASSGIEDDRVEFGHIVRREQSLREGLHRTEGRKIEFLGMEDDTIEPFGRKFIQMLMESCNGGGALGEVA